MSESLEKIMRLRQMNAVQGPMQQMQSSSVPFGMTPEQKRQAQGGMMMRLAAEMGNPKHQGKGLDRMLTTMVGSINPALDEFNQSEAKAVQENKFIYQMLKEEEREAKREARQLKKDMEREQYDRKRLEILAQREPKIKKEDEREAIVNKELASEGFEGVPYDKLTKNERLFTTKEMHKDLDKATSMSEAYNTLEEMDKILQDHPNLSQYLGPALADPKSAGSFFETLKRNMFINKDELTAFQKFTKLSNDLILHAGESLGAKNFTDAKLQVIQQSKPMGEYTYEANKYLIDNLKDRLSEGPAWADAIRWGLKNQYKVVREPGKYKKKNIKNSLASELDNRTVRGQINGKIVQIPLSLVDKFEEDGGIIIGD